jgi:hypothetical protein
VASRASVPLRLTDLLRTVSVGGGERSAGRVTVRGPGIDHVGQELGQVRVDPFSHLLG